MLRLDSRRWRGDMPRKKARPLLGQILVREMGLEERKLKRALAKQAELAASGRYYLIGRVLLGMGYITVAQLQAALRRQQMDHPG